MEQTLRQKILLAACHEAARAYYLAKGFPDVTLDKVGDWYKDSLTAIISALEAEDTTKVSESIMIEVIHRMWVDSMSKKGWSFGAFSEDHRTHPNMKPTALLESSPNHKKELLVILRAYRGMRLVLGNP